MNRLGLSEGSEQSLSLAVIGLGYVGLPLAHGATLVGMSVIGFDTSARTVESLNSGHSHIDDLSDDDVNTMLGGGFTATTHPANLGAACRSGVKETPFSGVFPLAKAIAARGAIPLVHDPLFTDDELRELGLTAPHRGDEASAAILQANHPEYLG